MSKASWTVDQNDRRSSQRDAGTTFIELLVSIVILGTAGIAVLTALSTTARGAAEHRQISNAQASLATAADALTKIPDDLDNDELTDPDNYVGCTTTPDNTAAILSGYQAVINPLALTPPVDVAAIKYWDSTGELFGTNCKYPDDRLQLITLETSVNGTTRTLAVVKRPAEEPISSFPLPDFEPGGTAVVPTPTPNIFPP